MANVIIVRDLHYNYDAAGEAPIQALRGIDLDLHEGEWLAIVGLNGSGKSTLAKCLAGLLRPTEGDVQVDGQSTRDHTALVAIRASVGMVFQNPENQFVTTVVEDEVAFGPENLGVPSAELRARVDQALAQVGLQDCAHRDPHTLSAGQRARLAIASILAMRPRCLILDEATAMLDPISRANVMDLVAELHAGGLTLVNVTHHMSEVTLADRLLVLDRGRIALQGTPADVLGRPEALAGIGLELPPAAAIAHNLQRRGLALPEGILTACQLADGVLALAGVAQ